MRKLLSHFMLMLVMMALAAPAMPAQIVAKAGSKTASSQAAQVVIGNDRMPQMRVKRAKNSNSAKLFKPGIFSYSPSSTREQMRRATGDVELWGNVTYADPAPGVPDAFAHQGIWRFNTAGNFLESYPAQIGDCYVAVCVNGIYHNYYLVEFGNMSYAYYEAFDVKTRQKVTTPVTTISLDNFPLALCTDGTNVYGQYMEGQNFKYGKFDLSTNTWTQIGSCDKQWNVAAFGKDGNIYAMDMVGDCYKVVPSTGATTKVGSSGVKPYYIGGAVIDPVSGRMFWTVSPEDENGYLYEVNTSTGAATKLCQFEFNDEVAGLFIPVVVDEEAPAAVQNLQANFTDNSLTGTVTFKCPTTLVNGTAATGALTYKVLANGVEVATGNCAYGENVTANITLSKADLYTFSVFVTNDKGDGPKTTTEKFVGNDTPNPTTVTIAYADGKFNVNWTAVTTAVNGGYIDLSKINYTVTRYPGGTVVAENTTETSLQDPVEIPNKYIDYYYTVAVNCGGLTSSVATSNTWGLGETKPPFLEEFTTNEAFKEFTVIDANKDGATWMWEQQQKAPRCKYHSSHQMDDWLISPVITLEAGKTYRVAIDARSNSTTYVERFEMKMGNAKTAEAMTVELIPPTELTTGKFATYEAFITPETSGNYHFGIHGISDKDKYWLWVDNFRVDAPMDGGVPGMATDLEAISDINGNLKAVIKGKAPSISLNGQPLTGNLTKIVLQRGDVRVDSVENIAPGAEFSIADNRVPTFGKATWSVVCYNEKGVGRSTEVSTFIGIDKPTPVSNIRMVENPEGTVTVTRDAPTRDIYGHLLGSTKVTYEVVYKNTSLIKGTEERTFTFEAVPAGQKQEFVQVGIYAKTIDGESARANGPFHAIGKAYATPWKESFSEHSMTYNLGLSNEFGNGLEWAIHADNETGLGVNSCDEDNGFIDGKGTALNDASLLFSGKVDLSTRVNPFFSFYVFNIISDTDGSRDINELEVVAREANADEWVVLQQGTIDNLCNKLAGRWGKISVSLAQFKGKNVQIGIKATCKKFVHNFFDKLEITDVLDHNLAAARIDAPATVSAQEEYTVALQVENRGTNAASGYTVDFYRNGASTPCKTYNGVPLEPGAVATYNVNGKLGFNDSDAEATYYAVVTYAADMNNTDNTSQEVTITRRYSNNPTPSNLTGEINKQKVSLNWTAPTFAAPRMAGSNLDDCESYTSWAYENVGHWTFVDYDQSPIGGFQGIAIPGSPSQQSLRSFIVFEHDESLGFNTTFAAHSGDKFFGSMFRWDAGKVDDWAISPKLSGNAQTLTFWAKSYSGAYQETMEILYTTSNSLAQIDYTVKQTVQLVPAVWTQYTIELPEGTKYFAIRNCSTDKYMLMLDDFTYEAAPAEVVGYNIYRDGEKLNTELISGTTYLDEQCPFGEHVYHVTAVYDTGEESAPSNGFTANVGVNSIEAGVNIVAGNGFITIAGADGKPVSINGINGVAYLNRVADGDIRIELAAGIYLVRVAGGTTKVVVR